MVKIETEIKTDIREAIKVKSIKLISQKAELRSFYNESIFSVDRAPGMYSPIGVQATLLFPLMSLICGEQGKGDSPACLSHCTTLTKGMLCICFWYYSDKRHLVKNIFKTWCRLSFALFRRSSYHKTVMFFTRESLS